MSTTRGTTKLSAAVKAKKVKFAWPKKKKSVRVVDIDGDMFSLLADFDDESLATSGKPPAHTAAALLPMYLIADHSRHTVVKSPVSSIPPG